MSLIFTKTFSTVTTFKIKLCFSEITCFSDQVKALASPDFTDFDWFLKQVSSVTQCLVLDTVKIERTIVSVCGISFHIVTYSLFTFHNCSSCNNKR